jgi:hypothetical protein
MAWFRRDDAGLKTQAAQRSADEVGAEAGLHADYATRQFLEFHHQRKSLDLPPKNDLAVQIEADKVENILADVDADGGEGGNAVL